jgi:hypothetical protein
MFRIQANDFMALRSILIRIYDPDWLSIIITSVRINHHSSYYHGVLVEFAFTGAMTIKTDVE